MMLSKIQDIINLAQAHPKSSNVQGLHNLIVEESSKLPYCIEDEDTIDHMSAIVISTITILYRMGRPAEDITKIFNVFSSLENVHKRDNSINDFVWLNYLESFTEGFEARVNCYFVLFLKNALDATFLTCDHYMDIMEIRHDYTRVITKGEISETPIYTIGREND